jgi:hypothetical protein
MTPRRCNGTNGNGKEEEEVVWRCNFAHSWSWQPFWMLRLKENFTSGIWNWMWTIQFCFLLLYWPSYYGFFVNFMYLTGLYIQFLQVSTLLQR